MCILRTIKHLRDLGIFSELDVHFTEFLATLSDQVNDELLLGAVLASYFTAQGHICVDLSVQAGQLFPLQSELSVSQFSCPSLSKWLDSLQNCNVVGRPGDYTPLILDRHRLYLYRYWDYEQQLAVQIRQRSSRQPAEVDFSILEEGLSRLFPAQDNESDNHQEIAARTAVLRHFCVISGGPGTGKTFTVVKILILLLEQNPNLNIALAAPTGKAAIRLRQAIAQTLPYLNCAPDLKAAIPQETYTIHRLLLGNPAEHHHFRHQKGSFLPYNVVVIDEASMVNLALMTQLAQAIPQSARWILLGDKDQLTSVEAGTVLSDLCDAKNRLQDNIVFLEHNYRFSDKSGIWALAQAVKPGQSDNAWRILKSESYPEVIWHYLIPSEGLPANLMDLIVASFARCLKESQPEKILQQFDNFRILCATHWGRYGVETLNRRIEEALNKKGLIRLGSRWYHGRPIMITCNDYGLKLFNGEIGIILKNLSNEGELKAFFLSPEGELRTFWPSRLPEHKTVFAMTIHKSQGSEFDNVLMLLPEQMSPLLTRELIYTGITRARQSVSIWGNERVFKQAVSQKISRLSGLGDALEMGNE